MIKISAIFCFLALIIVLSFTVRAEIVNQTAPAGSIIKVKSNTKFELGIGDMVNFTNYQDISFRLMKLTENEVILDVIFSPTTEIGQPYGGWGPNPELYPNLNITEKTPTTLYREVRECGTDKLKLDPQMIILDGFYMNYVCESRKQQHCYEDGSFDQYYNERCEYGQTGNVRQLTLPLGQSYAAINIKDKISSILITYEGISPEVKAKFVTREENQRPSVSEINEASTYSYAPLLVLTKSLFPSTITEGDATTIALRVENTGGNAKNVKITDAIPQGLTLLSGSASKEYSILKATETMTFQYTIKATGTGRFISDPAIVSYHDDRGNSFSGVSNSATITVQASTTEQAPQQQSQSETPGFGVIFAGIGIVLALVLRRR